MLVCRGLCTAQADAQAGIAQQSTRQVGRCPQPRHAGDIADRAAGLLDHPADHLPPFDRAVLRDQRQPMDRVQPDDAGDQEIEIPLRKQDRQSDDAVGAGPPRHELELAASEKFGKQPADDRCDPAATAVVIALTAT